MESLLNTQQSKDIALHFERKYRRKYKTTALKLRRTFFIVLLISFVVNAIIMVAINKDEPVQETMAAVESFSPTIDPTQVPKVEKVVTQQPTEPIVEAKMFPFTNTNSGLDTLPVLLLESHEQIKFTYDSSVPLPASLQYWISGLCFDYGIDPYFVYAVIERESYYGKYTVSKDKRDYGMMQIRDVNHDWLNKAFDQEINYKDDYENTMAGIYLLNKLIIKYNSYGVDRILMSYNMGEAGAKKAWDAGTHSTQYSKDIMQYYDKMKGEE